jgi:H-type lectin domain
MDHSTNPRADIRSDNVTPTGFDIVFRTWSDTRIARIRADWTAIGTVQDDEVWEVV